MNDVRVWYIKIEGKKEGPYTIADLRDDLRITPETLVWKKGFEKWAPIGEVRELRKIFRDRKARKRKKEEAEPEEFPARITPDGLVIDARGQPPNAVVWLAIVIFLIIYIVIRLRG